MTTCGAPVGGPALSEAGGATVIQGRVLRGGEPVGGAYVRLLDATGEFTAEVVTSATGEYRFFARPGAWTVRVLAGASRAGVEVAALHGVVSEVPISVGS